MMMKEKAYIQLQNAIRITLFRFQVLHFKSSCSLLHPSQIDGFDSIPFFRLQASTSRLLVLPQTFSRTAISVYSIFKRQRHPSSIQRLYSNL